jgi:hypothetical protein
MTAARLRRSGASVPMDRDTDRGAELASLGRRPRRGGLCHHALRRALCDRRAVPQPGGDGAPRLRARRVPILRLSAARCRRSRPRCALVAPAPPTNHIKTGFPRCLILNATGEVCHEPASRARRVRSWVGAQDLGSAVASRDASSVSASLSHSSASITTYEGHREMPREGTIERG